MQGYHRHQLIVNDFSDPCDTGVLPSELDYAPQRPALLEPQPRRRLVWCAALPDSK